MRVTRKIIEIDEELCDGCGQCIPSCSEGVLQIIDGKARLVSESYCDGLGACLGECPQGALRVVEREAEEFDEEAVEEYLEKSRTDDMEIPMGVCPSAAVKIFGDQPTSCETANIPRAQEATESRLGHWPVQINLVPVVAPFLKTGLVRGRFDGGDTSKDDNVGKRNPLVPGLPLIESALDLFEYLQDPGELGGLVNLPVLLWARRMRAPLAPPRLSEPRKVAAKDQAV